MLFMVVERFRPGQAAAAYRRLREKGRMAPGSVRYHGSWVDFEFRRCFQIMEAEREEDLRDWTTNWDDLIDFEIVPVRTSAEAAAAIATGGDS